MGSLPGLMDSAVIGSFSLVLILFVLSKVSIIRPCMAASLIDGAIPSQHVALTQI